MIESTRIALREHLNELFSDAKLQSVDLNPSNFLRHRMKRANVFARRGWIYSNPVSMTVAGPFVCLPPVSKAIATAQDSELGKMLRTALGQSRSGLMFDTRTPLTTHQDAVGVKTFGEFVRGTVMAGVEMDESVIRFEPYYNRGASEGFAHVPDDAFTMQATSSDEELGNAIRRVLALSK